jgi:hypothetical protein
MDGPKGETTDGGSDGVHRTGGHTGLADLNLDLIVDFAGFGTTTSGVFE